MDYLVDNYGAVIGFSVIPAYYLLYLIGKGAREWAWSPWAALVVVFTPFLWVIVGLAGFAVGLGDLAPGFFGRWGDQLAFGGGVLLSVLSVLGLRKRTFWEKAGRLVCLPLLLASFAFVLMFLIVDRMFNCTYVWPYPDRNMAGAFMILFILGCPGAIIACGAQKWVLARREG